MTTRNTEPDTMTTAPEINLMDLFAAAERGELDSEGRTIAEIEAERGAPLPSYEAWREAQDARLGDAKLARVRRRRRARLEADCAAYDAMMAEEAAEEG